MGVGGSPRARRRRVLFAGWAAVFGGRVNRQEDLPPCDTKTDPSLDRFVVHLVVVVPLSRRVFFFCSKQ